MGKEKIEDICSYCKENTPDLQGHLEVCIKRLMAISNFGKCFDDDKDTLDECHGCNVYYEILAKIKSISTAKGTAEVKLTRIKDLIYIGRLL